MRAGRGTTRGHAAKKSAAPPWERENPKAAGDHAPLSPQAKAAAKRHAEEAGRPYPNLVDNMRQAARGHK